MHCHGMKPSSVVRVGLEKKKKGPKSLSSLPGCQLATTGALGSGLPCCAPPVFVCSRPAGAHKGPVHARGWCARALAGLCPVDGFGVDGALSAMSVSGVDPDPPRFSRFLLSGAGVAAGNSLWENGLVSGQGQACRNTRGPPGTAAPGPRDQAGLPAPRLESMFPPVWFRFQENAPIPGFHTHCSQLLSLLSQAC